jgi:3-aminobutyryl-CoA ammonia-lyase
MLRVRLGTTDTHYRGNLIPAATVMRLFADCSTEIGIRDNGRAGMLAAYEGAEFLAPLRVGDYVEIRATVLSRGRRSRRVALEAWRLAAAPGEGAVSRDYTLYDPPELVARATMISVAPRPADSAAQG